jgi:hypothetical protein
MGGRTGKILDRFPSFMQAPTPDKVLATIAAALGSDLDECERVAARIQRSHRIAVADEASDVLRLAALAALRPADFFIVDALQRHGLYAKLAEQLNVDEGANADPPVVSTPLPDDVREQRGYDAYVDALRTAVKRSVAVIVDGCGTVRALMEGAAILLDATPLEPGGAIELLDADPVFGGFEHRVRVRHHVIDGEHVRTREGAIVLVENPIVFQATPDAERGQRERFRVARGGFFGGPPTIEITGTANRTVGPMLVNGTTHEGIGYDGVLEDGQRLTFTFGGKVLLDGADVTARTYAFRGGLFDDLLAPAPAGDPAPEPWWLNHVAAETPAGGLDRDEPGAPAVPVSRLPMPDLPIGESEWRFSVREGAFDAARFDESVHVFPAADDAGSPAALEPCGRVRVSWREHDPFAVTVLIPAELATLQDAGLVDGDLPTLVHAGLQRFRAAGVRLAVRYFAMDWVLGTSALGSPGAKHGPGIDFDATVLSPPTHPS